MNELNKLKFKQFFNSTTKAKKNDTANESEDEDNEDNKNDSSFDKGYDYLLSMKLWSLTHEKVVALTKQRDEKYHELELLEKKDLEDLYSDDLDGLEVSLAEFEQSIRESEKDEEKARLKAKGDRKNNSKFGKAGKSKGKKRGR